MREQVGKDRGRRVKGVAKKEKGECGKVKREGVITVGLSQNVRFPTQQVRQHRHIILTKPLGTFSSLHVHPALTGQC